MKLTKIYKILKSKQDDWIIKYIDFNTEKKTNTKIEFEKGLFKLMNNSAYSKTMENLRKRMNFRLVSNTKGSNMLANQLLFLKKKISKNLTAIHEIKPVLVPNKPIYVGFTVLELSKYLMDDFHYNFIKKKFDADLLFADLLSYEIKSKMFMKNFLNINTCLTLVNINQKFLIQQTKKLLAKRKMNLKEFLSINILG